ncbi:MAG: hypothetical protein DSO07_09435 [Thermoproteota archaeon]|jgi:DNA-binding Lrp family transcriptional regulator|uniref:Lrp/AsnC family transcriptional regulator n=1 Tax=Candidatus Methanodesulfokora washburnensis TaxID=2478471 RepID=A0A3R9RN85_9CREN|nr:hypothetical protein [Candidatus Methanodesulfokores washburnensis]RSN74339.1 hypothetical protein D6D85_08195 [Candidatus Methanodesulfokores washburnensis]RZN62572.1 MAG: hypothetical protein EF810_02405 [Candidatus Methanodesulfokores washburnensis]TDA40326.1 MAG: hypothetical protein DSO07_09435 [Candidatus Korarchaeota archaeon]
MNLAKIVSNEYIEYFRKISLVLDDTNLRIIDAIKKIGPRNMSRIARYVGEDPKKVSYRFNVIKNKTGLVIRALPSYSSMGLTNTVLFLPLSHVRVEPVKKALISMKIPKKIYRTYGNISGLMVQMIVPNQKIHSLSDIISSILLEEEKKSLKLLYLTDFIVPTLDFSRLSLTYKIWDYAPSELKKDFLKGERMKLEEKQTMVPVDKIDVYILSKLADDATIPFLQMTKETKISPARLKYHFDNHIIKRKMIRDYYIYFPRYSPEFAGFFSFEFTFDKEEYMERFLYALNRSIYSHGFAKELGKLRIVALMEIFWGDLSEVLQTLSELCVSGYLVDYKFSYIDLRNIYVSNLTPDMFDEKTGWNVPEDLGLSSVYLNKYKIKVKDEII